MEGRGEKGGREMTRERKSERGGDGLVENLRLQNHTWEMKILLVLASSFHVLVD